MSLFSVLLSLSEAFIFTTIRDSPQKLGWKKEIAMILHLRNKDDVNSGLLPRREPLAAASIDTAGISRRPRLTAQSQTEEDFVRVDVRWNMVFTWQAPVMLMSYSTIFFLLGLSIFVLTPLYDGRNFDGYSKVSAILPGSLRRLFRNFAKNCLCNKAAIFYIVSSVLGGAVFVWCSYWAYRFVDLDGEGADAFGPA